MDIKKILHLFEHILPVYSDQNLLSLTDQAFQRYPLRIYFVMMSALKLLSHQYHSMKSFIEILLPLYVRKQF